MAFPDPSMHREPLRPGAAARASKARFGRLRPLAALVAAASLAMVGVPATASDEAGETLEGTLLDVVIEAEGHGEAEEAQVIISEDGEVDAVEGEALEDIESGSTVEATVEGSEVQSATVVAPAEATVAVASHRAYVVTIDDASATEDVSLADAVANTEYAADYWVTEARGAIGSFEVADTATMSWDGSCSASYSEIWTAAKAEFPGVSFVGTANHLIVYSPEDCDYGYAGIATVGSSFHYGGTVQITALGTATTVHELGHNLSLGHSYLTWETGSAEYFGVYGPQALTVSGFPSGALDAAYRYDLDLPGASSLTDVLTYDADASQTTTVTLNQTTASSGTTAATVVDPDDGSEYFVEYRSGLGVDSSAFYSYDGYYLFAYSHALYYEPGVVVSRIQGSDGEIEILAVEDGSDMWSSFQAGEAYTAGSDLFTVTVVSTTSTTATVEIVTNPTAPAAEEPTDDPTEEPAAADASTTTVSVPSVYRGTAPEATVTVAADTTPTGDVDLYVDGSIYTTVSLTDGDVTAELSSSLAVGTHAVRAVYGGADGIAGSESTTELTVTPKVATEASATAKTKRYGNAIKVVVAVEGAEGAGGQVVVSRGSSTWEKTLRDDGTVAFWMPATWKPGQRTLSVAYEGTSTHASSTATVVAKTLKAIPTVRVTNSPTVEEGKSSVFAVKVTGPLKAKESGKVAVYVDGKRRSQWVTLELSGSAYKAKVKSWKLPKGRVEIRYLSRNDFLTSKRQSTSYFAR
ncbi:Ig-like domain repeat protein [Demequina sp. NBRC 110054]|uniref:Ig-like domain repeat protein n=1 Tax=Demequina sp. NBRC 110054 TaxID=1570343 RepID=UPI001177FEAE|nr:Ig-like domain repeat protein [Demequina sp. NBRC 110054]